MAKSDAGFTTEPHRDDLSYVDQTGRFDSLQSEQAELDGKVFLKWVCPVCGGDVQTQEVHPQAVFELTQGTLPRFAAFTCDCGRVHSGNPGNATGCGYGFTVTVKEISR